jgi:hypothetical protein
VLLITKYFGQHSEIFWGKKLSLSLHLIEMVSDPDRQALDADPDPAK